MGIDELDDAIRKHIPQTYLHHGVARDTLWEMKDRDNYNSGKHGKSSQKGEVFGSIRSTGSNHYRLGILIQRTESSKKSSYRMLTWYAHKSDEYSVCHFVKSLKPGRYQLISLAVFDPKNRHFAALDIDDKELFFDVSSDNLSYIGHFSLSAERDSNRSTKFNFNVENYFADDAQAAVQKFPELAGADVRGSVPGMQ